MSQSNTGSFEEVDQSDGLDLDAHELFDDAQRPSNKAKKEKTAPKKKAFPLVPALAALFVVVGGAMGWQWWSQHHHDASSPPAQAGGGMGLLEHPLPLQNGVQQTGLMAMDNAPAAASSATKSAAAPAAAISPVASSSRPATATPSAMGAAVSPPVRPSSQPSRSLVSVVAPTAAVQAKQESSTQSSPQVQQAETASRSDTAALSRRIDAIDQEIRAISSRLSVIQSEMKVRRTPTVASAAPEPARPRTSAQIVAVNGDVAVVAIEGQFHKVAVGTSIPGFGRVIRVDQTGIQTSVGGWIKR